MKKSLIALSLATLSAGATADTILGVYAGAGSWAASYSGEAGSNDFDVEELGLDDTSNLFVYGALEHPVPLVPNIRVAYTEVQVDGTATLTSDFELDDETFTGDIYADMDLTHTDATLYYELLDNWVSLDLGLTARFFDGYIYAESRDETLPAQSERVELSETVPLVYARTQFELPLTGWHVGVGGNFVSYSGDSFSDLDAKIGYASDGLLLDFGIDLGYRRMNLSVDDVDDMTADVTIDGPYLEGTLHF